MQSRDVIIVGAGPAGLAAGIYTARSGLETIILEKGLAGGLVNITDRIDNYPGFPEGVSGFELGERMRQQAERFGATIVTQEVRKVKKMGREIQLTTDGEEYAAPAAIIATGSTPKKIGVPGEEEYIGKGVSYCATCDGPLYRNKVAAVIGGGDSALQEAIYLAGLASTVQVIHRRDQLRGAKILQDEIRRNPKIVLHLNKRIVAIEGENEVNGVRVEDKATGKVEKISADGIFIYVGYSPSVSCLGDEFEKTSEGFLVTKPNLETSVEGVFAAGDVRAKELRQVVTAAGDGALAAMSVYAYLQSLRRSP